MSEINVIDSSAILALLTQEPGAALLEQAIKKHPSWVSSVIICEVLGKLLDGGMTRDEATQAVAALRLTIADFDENMALETAVLKARTKSIGASMGDRACLALAAQRMTVGDKPTVFTADRVWAKLQWPFRIIVIR